MKYRKYLALKDNLLKIFLADKESLSASVWHFRDHFIIRRKYAYFYTVEVKDVLTMIYVPDDEFLDVPNDFIDVTHNHKFKLREILNESVFNVNVVIEGSDGVGKSTLVNNLAQAGILCQDRAVNQITRKMKPEIDEQERLEAVRLFLEEDTKREVIFIFLSDEAELEKRVFSRGAVSEFDRKTVCFQRLYVQTYFKLKGEFDNLFLLDCLGKSEENMVSDVKGIIFR